MTLIRGQSPCCASRPSSSLRPTNSAVSGGSVSGGAVRPGRAAGRPHGQVGVLAQDALVQLGQQRARLGALLVDQAGADVPVEAQRLTRPAGPVQRRHLVRGEGLVQRVLGQQLMELADQVGVPAQLQLALDPLQDGRPAFLREAVAHPRHPVTADPRERLAAPEPVRLAQQPGGLVGAAGGQRVRLPAQAPELVQVDRVRVDVEFVAAVASRQPDVVTNGLPQCGAEPGDVDRQALPGLWRRLCIPDPVNENAGRHYRARRQHQDGQDARGLADPRSRCCPSDHSSIGPSTRNSMIALRLLSARGPVRSWCPKQVKLKTFLWADTRYAQSHANPRRIEAG